jgi:hypothetical protein
MGSLRGLECRVGLGRIILPTDAIALLGEYDVGTRLPLNDRVGYAIGVWDNDVVLSVALARHEPVPRRQTSGAMLNAPHSAVRWAFEIDGPVGLVDVVAVAKPGPGVSWRRTATLGDGRSVQFIDVAMMLREVQALLEPVRP